MKTILYKAPLILLAACWASGCATGADVDSDADGLTDAKEVALSTDVANPDTDGDGVSDGYEHDHHFNPLDRDTDRDGVEDGDEDEDGDGTCERDEDGHFGPGDREGSHHGDAGSMGGSSMGDGPAPREFDGDQDEDDGEHPMEQGGTFPGASPPDSVEPPAAPAS